MQIMLFLVVWFIGMGASDAMMKRRNVRNPWWMYALFWPIFFVIGAIGETVIYINKKRKLSNIKLFTAKKVAIMVLLLMIIAGLLMGIATDSDKSKCPEGWLTIYKQLGIPVFYGPLILKRHYSYGSPIACASVTNENGNTIKITILKLKGEVVVEGVYGTIESKSVYHNNIRFKKETDGSKDIITFSSMLKQGRAEYIYVYFNNGYEIEIVTTNKRDGSIKIGHIPEHLLSFFKKRKE